MDETVIEWPTAEEIESLREIEKGITARFAEIRSDHEALREMDTDSDPTLLRPYLDKWMGYHLWAAEWLVLAKQVRRSAETKRRDSWQRVHVNTRSVDLASQMEFYGAYEERKAYYDMKIAPRTRAVEALDSVIDTVYDFITTLKAAATHWDKRRVDTKWELDRMT